MTTMIRSCVAVASVAAVLVWAVAVGISGG